ncbi:Uncharacterized conserved protein YbjT, contains NAD(P)-binding and DUF2867 domains [Streptoalloteichus tenebrarius]|uniref:Uncharacterized conserved protein YbjT, contains NAD(P)-binding and DUF2867 domains n=1 Tax=Streptoalloteichus tenebrarius (strain ATCC 17920 / DSM 40477 / JCM 4838 / CBS 697.72 / NBRC 16177 / NCIMB 11028 / NRRL B-12390 / A12253. 1 / ISP 5477) TaxID=1933 RepID=A0ABT1HPN2_STRSD|nr:NAD(P)H-binding protein [Streptoalloteichus tenebrarius]MCP2257484.1 Uncharacterized conserved protein YbjT, contains NAD(P)-binding and DUF2867 domains [Streptoalloteichus tenebrarius]BFE98433.1 NAD(P)H-binding protein [Streptoalloteichus tenebrarius]
MYLITGATGNVGRHLVDHLLAAGVPVRATTRHPRTAHLPDPVEVLPAEETTFPLEGVRAVFVNPSAVGHHLDTLLTQARTHGVRRVVLLSTSAVLDEANPIGAHHRELEDQLVRSGLPWTVLRPGAFNSNTLGWADQIRTEGVVRAPYGGARIAPIDERDIAAVAAQALLSHETDRLRGATPVLSGPEIVTPVDQVRAIGAATGVPLRFEEMPPEDAREAMPRAGVPALAADGVLRYHAHAALHPVEISPAVEEITGRAPRRFADWAVEHAAAFKAGR